MSDATQNGPMLAADGRPLKASLRRALRRQKMRALMLIAPLLIFILITFIAPIADMLFRSVENNIVSDTLPRTVEALDDWEYASGETPGEPVFDAMFVDLFIAAERKEHTRLGSRLNYQETGISSLFRQTGRDVEDMAEVYEDQFDALNEIWRDGAFWAELMGDPDWFAEAQGAEDAGPRFRINDEMEDRLPRTAEAYRVFARFTQNEDEDNPASERPWPLVHAMLYADLTDGAAIDAYTGFGAEELTAAKEAVPGFEAPTYREAFLEVDEDWASVEMWGTIKAYSGEFTSGYFLNAVDRELTPHGIETLPSDQSVYLKLFWRTIWMSLTITFMTILLGYPVAYLLANLPMRKSSLLMILVLLPFWTSLLVRTSAWKVLLQQQGVINDILVWAGILSDSGRLVMINNQLGTIIAMTHILLPFMILPLYSVMATIPPSFVRASKSLGATNWTTFWRVYFPQSVPGIGAGSILVFILAIGYYITPALVGGTDGIFISNRIAYHISSSLNWGLAAALGSILLAAVLVLYWAYDRIVGIDNVKLG
ncbi:ABC transporter permease [uncultured Maritimibacter sp.]|jgi:putative spermidine/putrescine transport system permease protein|uniref:ABC transporter permease n=1 Tax=uncultured Maritimibacter sp. TaxID=991866 RepID=UPI000AE02D07|nr:ABC transporter permease [uncultured Maritimibacter sp.]